MQNFIDRYEGPIVLVVSLVFFCLLMTGETIGWSHFCSNSSLPSLLGFLIVPLSLSIKGYGLVWAMYRGLIEPMKRFGLEPSALLVSGTFLLNLVVAMGGFWLLANWYFWIINIPLDAIGLPTPVPALLALAAAYPFSIGIEAVANNLIVLCISRDHAAQ
jgi:hypothetical protein